LKQAAGKVRCGGCGNAFNALEYLSESMPERQPAKPAEEDLPELKPEPPPSDGAPVSISAEQSAALLKTLDELAGSDIRIEDTGVEWRVLDDDEIGEAAGDDIAMDVDVEDQPEIDEILEDSPTPVDQFLTDTPPEVDSPEIFSEELGDPLRTPVEELRFDDNTPLPDDFDLDNEASYSPVSEDRIPEPKPAPIESPQVDLDLSEPDEWTDILDEFEDLVVDLADVEEDERPLDVDAQFALQAEAMGIDLSGAYESLEAPVEEETSESEETAGTFIDEDIDTLLEDPGAAERDIEDLLEEEIVEAVDDGPDDDVYDELDLALDDALDVEDAGNSQLDFIEQAGDEPEKDICFDVESDDEPAADALFDDEPDEEPAADALFDDEPDEEPAADHLVPPMTEEEQTINMQIDQDLLAIAVEDNDGFTSTLVLPEDAAGEPLEDANEDREEHPDEHFDLADTGAGFETIIMEGEFVRSDIEQDKLAADAAAAANLAGAAAAEKAAEKAAGNRKTSYGMAAGLVVLALLLIGQVLHQSRNTLATIPAFNDTVGPLYRAIGQPLSPDWDITGWRFEVTEQRTAEDDSSLVVYSRIGNTSDKALPYPIIAVSLTDRFQEPLGSITLDPAEYLASDLDPRRLVEAGNRFEANFTVNAIPEEAASYQLRACYRSESGLLRCKEDDFK
jgi:hypothetical protein